MNYPKIDDSDFYDKINKIYKKYKIEEKKRTFNQICFPDKFELQNQQQFLAKYINPKTRYNGVLIYHKIGAGKTCTAVSIGEAWKHTRKIFFVAPASLTGTFRNELRSKCAGNSYLTDNEREKLKNLHPADPEYEKIIKKSDDRINVYYRIYSYNKFIEFAEYGEIKLNNSVLIIDEIQNMISENGKWYEVLYKLVHQAPSNLKIVILSATPMFDKPTEIALTMNILKIPFELPTGTDFNNMFITTYKTLDGVYHYKTKNLDIFKERIKGYISYYAGAPSYVFPELVIKYVKCPMSDFQYTSYRTVLASEGKEETLDKFKKKFRIFRKGDILDLPNNFFIGTRMISNIAFPNKSTNEKGLLSLKGVAITKHLEKYSSKFYKIMRKINRCKGKVFVYSNFKNYGGLMSFTKVLEAFGYKSYAEHGIGRKRFAIWSGDVKMLLREEVKSIYNRYDNLDGSKIKIILGSSAIKEGISFTAIRQIHIIEGYWNSSRMAQIIGRGVRFCSHKDVSKEDRNVKVYVYIATHENEEQTIDEYITYLAMQKKKLIDHFEQALKESAIDCELFHSANKFAGDIIKCDN